MGARYFVVQKEDFMDSQSFKKRDEQRAPGDSRQGGGNHGNGEQGNRQDGHNHNQGKPKNVFEEEVRKEYGRFADISTLDKFVNSPFVLVGLVVTIIVIGIGFIALREDIFTSKQGWDSLPLNMAYANTGWYMAIALSASPFFFYMLSLVTGWRGWRWIAVICMLSDSSLDMMFRMKTSIWIDFWQWLIEAFWGTILSFGIFNIMSEVFIAGGIPLFFFLLPYSIEQGGLVLAKLVAAIVSVDNWFANRDTKDKK